MPVEILEIIVKANIQQQATTAAGNGSSQQPNNNIERQKLVQECVEQVLAVLQHSKER